MLLESTSAGSVAEARPDDHRASGGSNPTSALQPSALFKPKDVVVALIPHIVARSVCRRYHYSGSYPGGSLFNFGMFVRKRLLGVAVLGVGPVNVYQFFEGALPSEVVCLTRFWLDDRLGRNAESRVLGIVLRLVRRHQSLVKAVVAYSDPAAGHDGTIYRGAGFLYLGQSEAMPLYRLPDGTLHHSRSLGHSFGSHSVKHFRDHGVEVELVPQQQKHTYVALIDRIWRDRLTRPVLAYPKSGPERIRGS